MPTFLGEGENLTDTKKLNAIITEKGYKKGWIAEKIGLSAYGLSLKIHNKNQFNAGEIQKLCDLLNITSLHEKDSIFFAREVDNMPT